jgi:hypothetical protein
MLKQSPYYAKSVSLIPLSELTSSSVISFFQPGSMFADDEEDRFIKQELEYIASSVKRDISLWPFRT